MFYRYEARRIDSIVPSEWCGIFQHLNPSESRQWRNLHEPKWYRDHPFQTSQAWFTQHGYDRWHEKMEETLRNNVHYAAGRLEVRLLQKETLNKVVMKGKTQVIVLV